MKSHLTYAGRITCAQNTRKAKNYARRVGGTVCQWLDIGRSHYVVKTAAGFQLVSLYGYAGTFPTPAAAAAEHLRFIASDRF